MGVAIGKGMGAGAEPTEEIEIVQEQRHPFLVVCRLVVGGREARGPRVMPPGGGLSLRFIVKN